MQYMLCKNNFLILSLCYYCHTYIRITAKYYLTFHHACSTPRTTTTTLVTSIVAAKSANKPTHAHRQEIARPGHACLAQKHQAQTAHAALTLRLTSALAASCSPLRATMRVCVNGHRCLTW